MSPVPRKRTQSANDLNLSMMPCIPYERLYVNVQFMSCVHWEVIKQLSKKREEKEFCRLHFHTILGKKCTQNKSFLWTMPHSDVNMA